MFQQWCPISWIPHMIGVTASKGKKTLLEPSTTERCLIHEGSVWEEAGTKSVARTVKMGNFSLFLTFLD